MAAVLVQSALSLAWRPYTGLALRGDWVAAVDPGSPGERAGLAPGDSVRSRAAEPGRAVLVRGPLVGAAPGRPLQLERAREDRRDRVWLVPEPLPDGERDFMAGLLAVASGFVLLGSWVWSERRDRLTRTFFLLCLAFAWLLAPPPSWTSPAPALAYEVIQDGITLYLPALFIHFFALFPESRPRVRPRAWVRSAYVIATALFVAAILAVAMRAFARGAPDVASDAIQAIAAVWFAAGSLIAIALFALSYLRAGSADARRRLRVALVGTALGAGPLAGLIAFRSFAPSHAVPGERWAVLFTLLVPASFAWATAVHRVFDFRVALRAGLVTLVLALAGGVAYAVGDSIAVTWWPGPGSGIAGGALAFVALAASLAGPAAPWLGRLGARVVPLEGEASLAGWTSKATSSPARWDGTGIALERENGAARLLAEGCEAVRRFLRLDDCRAVMTGRGGARAVDAARADALGGEPGLSIRAGHLPRSGVHALEAVALDPEERRALEEAGVSWILPIGAEPMRAALLLGPRLAGAWLSRRETLELERFAQHLAVELENATLRDAADSRGALERELAKAGAYQAHLLPRHAPVCPTLDCAAAALSCEPVGGDYYDFVQGPGRDFTLAVGDAAGKGLPAALLLAQVQARFRDQARRGLSPGELLGELNQELVELDQPERFVGLLCARIEVRSGRVWFANAGLTPPLVRRRDGSFEEVLAGGVLLGVSREASYPNACVELRAGDMVVVYTDGLTEARRGEELFGADRLREVLARTPRRRAADILEALLSAVRSFADRPLDDLTVVVLRQLASPAQTGPRTAPDRPGWRPLSADAAE